jgi:putative glutamine amidotransferase
MGGIASWIRESDEENFARFFTPHPGLKLLNARRAPVDLDDAAGLILTGGPDISLEFLRQPVADPSVIEDPGPDRDAWEFAALAAALKKGLPILAVCKGVQVLNVGLGGTLHLDIRGHNLPAQKLQNIQPVRNDAGATIRFEQVNSSHHQALDRLGDGLTVESWCETDDIVEQVRLRDYPFALGVQYHPERDMVYAPLFELFASQIKAPP